MKITHFIVFIFCLVFFCQCDKKKEVVQQTQFNFPVIATIDLTVYAEIQKTSAAHWDLSQMIETTYKVEKNGVEYLIQCDGNLNGGYYNFTLITDENGQWESDSKLIVPTKSYGYDSWPGKDGTIKTEIEFPTHFIAEYNLSLVPGYTSDSFTYQIALSNTDTEKTGSIAVKVFQGAAFAQMPLQTIYPDSLPQYLLY